MSEGKRLKTADFRGELTPNGQIAVLRSVDDAALRALGRRRFEAAYAADDSVYESLIHDPSRR